MDVYRGGMTRVSAGLSLAGELHAEEDIEVQGQIDGQVHLPDHHLQVRAGAVVRARIVASSVTIFGTVDGAIAADRVVLEPTAVVRGHLLTPGLTLREGAQFTGTVDPARSEAAIHIAKYRQKHAEAATPV